MEIEPVGRVDGTDAAGAVDAVMWPQAQFEAHVVGASNAATCTGFDPAACASDPIEASIAAAAAAQDLRLFVQGPRRAVELRDRPSSRG